MRHAIATIKCSGALALTALLFCTDASASPLSSSTLFVDDGVGIYSYSLATSPSPQITSHAGPGSFVTGMAFTSQDVLLAASAGGILDVTGTEGVLVSGSFQGLAINAAGRIFAGANNGSTLEEYGPDGTPLFSLGTGLSVDSLAINAAGDVFEADFSGKINEFIPGSGNTFSETSSPFATVPIGAQGLFGLAFDSSGNLYVGYDASGNGEMDEISSTGQRTLLEMFSSSILPTGLAYDPISGSLYMAYSNFGTSGGGVDVFSAFTNTCTGIKVGTVCSAATALSTAAGATALVSPYGIAILTPEPGTMVLLGAGLISLALIGRRRSRQ